MKRYCLLAAFMLLSLTGCVSHYYRTETDTVNLYLRRPDATVVDFASSLDAYQLHRAEKTNNSTWKVTLPAHREFTYFYIVDGVAFLPSCKFKEQDDFGSTNCIYIPGM